MSERKARGTQKHTKRETYASRGPPMLNIRGGELNTVFYPYLARFMNIVALNMNMFLSVARRITLFVFLLLSPRNT